jgi:phage tail sheath protein FI
MTALRTPGAYYERVDAGGPDVAPLRTDITGFIGIAERGPLDLPVPVQSWRQFVSWFGDVTPVGYLAYAVRGFFENGGRRCWIVRVASNDPAGGAACAAVDVGTAAGPAWRIRAASEGGWGNHVTVSAREVNRVQVPGPLTAPDGGWTQVASVAGLERWTHVRVRQPGSTPVLKIVSDVDPVTQRVYWVQPDGRRLRYDAPLTGLDRGAPVMIESLEYRLVVAEDDRLVAAYDQLTLIPESPAYGPQLLAPISAPIDPVTGRASASPPRSVVIEELRDPGSSVLGLDLDPTARLPLTGGQSGLALLAPYDFFGEPVAPDDSPFAVALKRRGMRTLESIAEIGLLAVPDALIRPVALNPLAPPPACVPDPCLDPASEPVTVYGPSDTDEPPIFTDAQVFQVQAQLVDQCERLHYRFALLDPPFASATDEAGGLRGVLDWRARFETSYAALNYPWVGVLDPLVPAGGVVRLVPASGHVAGRYAATDLEIGVHRAAANQQLSWALRASIDVDAERHGTLNEGGVNAIRTVNGRGLRLLGARTVCSDPDWRYVPVRRLMAMIEKALEIALQWVVFEPNGVLTRARVTMTVTMFLLGLHEAGMLAGATPEESFTVRCDVDNNPTQQTDLGELLVEVGVAPVVPFEFVVVRVGKVSDSLVVRSDSISVDAA